MGGKRGQRFSLLRCLVAQALDPAKMNRGICVSRSTPGLQDLVKSARGICQNNPSVLHLIAGCWVGKNTAGPKTCFICFLSQQF